MEVDQAQYRKSLLGILKHISTATFVAFDLEMSGIATRSKHGAGDKPRSNGKPSLQQLYEETKAAAETFQVLQLGITCVDEDRDREYYLARPYNFNVSPLFFEDNRFKDRFPERKFTFSSSACDFLQREGFNFGKVFSDGVYYLSQEEEQETRERYSQRLEEKTKKSDVIIPSSDSEALEFYSRARKTISEWTTDPKPAHDFVNIGNPAGPLNGFQRLLVHQLVKNEFPGYRSFARNNQSFVQIEKINAQRESEVQKENMSKFNSAVSKQIGLRWIFEALTGGDLAGIESSWFHDDSSDRSNQKEVEREFQQVKKALKAKTHIIIGHNLFMDLVYLYKTFVGTLHDRVEEFQNKIHQLFPIVIDTKYLASHGTDSMNPRANLEDLLEPFRKVHIPLIVLHEKHTAYGPSASKSHEAGFDSWMTAELFVKLSIQLYSKSHHLSESRNNESDSDLNSEDTCSADEDEPGGASLKHPDFNDFSHSMRDDLPPAWHARQLNPYAVLSDEADDVPRQPKPRQWIPSMRSTFWDVYTNKLRVNAVEGGVCDLNGSIA